MKFAKAMEKARSRNMTTPLDSAQRPSRAVRPTRGAERGAPPPVYGISRTCEPDPAVLEENRCVCFMEDAPEIDCYKMLRAQIMQHTKIRGWNTVMITSAVPGEGKTVTAINLAMTFAKAYDQTVLLVDCDLRQQKVYRYMGIDSNLGIVDHLVEGRPLNEMIIWPGIAKMTLISGGRTVNESAELLGSARMKAMVEEMKARYTDRYILLDAPPILSGADALTLSSLADGLFMVVEASRTPLKEIQEALDLMPKDKFLGFVLNKHSGEKNSYYRYYGYRSKGRAGR
jgi:protein-tyrosine kinase